MNHNAIGRLLRPQFLRLRGMIGRAVIRLVDDARKLQTAQVTVQAGEVRAAERFQDYGVSSVPLDGAEAIVLFVGGDRGSPVVIRTDDRRHRPTNLAPGEVVIYTDEGARVHLKRGRLVEITAEVVKVNGRVEVSGDVTAGGNVSDGTRSLAADRALYNAHTHAGVQTGSGSTAPPIPQE